MTVSSPWHQVAAGMELTLPVGGVMVTVMVMMVIMVMMMTMMVGVSLPWR
jgi:hypothetical protein